MSLEDRLTTTDMHCPNSLCTERDTVIEYTKAYPVKYCAICGTLLIQLL